MIDFSIINLIKNPINGGSPPKLKNWTAKIKTRLPKLTLSFIFFTLIMFKQTTTDKSIKE